MTLEPDDIKPFLSPYLIDGWKKDNISITKIDYEEGKISCLLNVNEYFTPADGEFHFTVPLAFIFIAQLGIIYGCLENGLPKKPGEIFLREINLQCRTIISKKQDIQIEIKLASKTKVQGGIYYIGVINIENGAMSGIGKYILPIN